MTKLKFLRDVQFPASPKDLFTAADRNRAGEDILDMISTLPDVNFKSPEDVKEAMNIEETPKKTVQKNGQKKRHNASHVKSGRVLITDKKIKEAVAKFNRGELKAPAV